ncbi:MAG: sugar ABC transporter ATP-binding protein [Verrucomicrobiales bacterium]
MKTFPGVRALDGVSLDLHKGEVLALMGENGAGKSTLIKILSGVYQPDQGEIHVDGLPQHFHRPAESQAVGISVIYQELDLIPQLTVAENLFLGRERNRHFGFLDSREEIGQTREQLSELGVRLDPGAKVETLTVAEQQFVEIAKALAVDARIVVMDEPTAALSQREVERLFDIIGGLKSRGIGVIYISHRMDEVDRVADRVTVLRDGAHIGDLGAGQFDRDKIIHMMVGRSLDAEFPKQKVPRGEEILQVEHLQRPPKVRDVSFSLHRGELLGLTGLIGAGRTETARLIFGAERPSGGRIHLEGQPAEIHSPGDAIRRGICLLTEDRKTQGLVLCRSVQENFGLPNLDRLRRGFLIDETRELEQFESFSKSLRIRVPGAATPASALSGGNQQKLVLAKWLERETDIIIFDEPTRGIDVGAKVEIYELMNRLAAKGKAILMISSELPEILGMSDRVLVMHEGEIAGEIADPQAATQEDILSLAMERNQT